jgi:hypothetical protein
MRKTIMLLSVASLTVLAAAPAAWAAPSQVTANPKIVNFGRVTTGTTLSMVVTFTNHGTSDLTFVGSAILPPGSSAFDFDFTFLNTDPTSCPYLEVNSPPALRANGGSCAEKITFSPTDRLGYHAAYSMNFGTSEGFITESLSLPLIGQGS